MGNSLQDQFLKAGLVDKKKHNESKKEKYAQKASGAKNNEIADMARQAMAEKKRKDQQLNKKKIAQRQAKEATAQARQIVETHKIAIEPGNIAYNFKDENSVKKLYFTEKTVQSLAKGKVGIVKLAGEYQLVPADTIYRVRKLNSKLVVLLNTPQEKNTKDTDDPYAEYEIPDDLMW